MVRFGGGAGTLFSNGFKAIWRRKGASSVDQQVPKCFERDTSAQCDGGRGAVKLGATEAGNYTTGGRAICRDAHGGWDAVVP